MLWTKAGIQRTKPTIGAGALRLDTANKNATLTGNPIELSPLLWRLLRLLAERPHQLVTRAELKRALWPYAERIDTERRLNTAVRALRAALGDAADSPLYIKTERSYGYRWVGRDRSTSQAAGAATLLLGCLAVVIASAGSFRPMQKQGLASIMRAQYAVEEWRGTPTPVALARAERLVTYATSRAQATPTLLVLRAELELGGRWNWQAAERDYRAALSLDPANADARFGLAWLAANRDDRTESLRLAGQLLTSTVVTGERRSDLGWLLIRLKRPDLALNACGINSGASINRLTCAHTALAALGRFGEARSVALQVMASLNAKPRSVARIQALPASSGYAEFLNWRVANFLPPHAPWFQRAQILADAGRRKEALDSLALSVAAHEPHAVKIASTPSFRALGPEPRFQRLAQAVGVTARSS